MWPFSSKKEDDGYKGHPEAVIISCFYNPTNSEYRLKAYNEFYSTIKHLNHRIIECVIGDAKPQLQGATVVRTKNMLWHKEALLNNLIKNLPAKFKYVFWLDADVLLQNKNWLPLAVSRLQTDCVMVQPFQYAIHLEKDMDEPDFDVDKSRLMVDKPINNRKIWRGFASNWEMNKSNANSKIYDVHGHVGFAWGARRELLDEYPLYDRAMIGGADHIIAHAAVGHIPHECITKSFTDDIDQVTEWSKGLYERVQGKIGYVPGDVWHIWHGDINKRGYLKRIKDFTQKTKYITERDENGLYITDDPSVLDYLVDYFMYREIFDPSMIDPSMIDQNQFDGFGGGNFGGAGAGASWDNSQQQPDTDTAVAPSPTDTLNTPDPGDGSGNFS